MTIVDKFEGWFDKNKQLHREDGPAIMYQNGGLAWCKHGEYHRIGGPAVTYSDGAEKWYEYGKFHRIGGPAVTHSNGTKEWYENDNRHRIGGPAITYIVGQDQWFVYGETVTSWKDYQWLSECSNEDLVFLKLEYESPS